jgi:HD-like signal output (HDOD) protein
VAEKEAFRAIYRLAHEDLVMPSDPAHPVDDALRALVQRALARDASLRWASAADMASALREWASAAQGDGQSNTDSGHNATLEFLLRRMRRTTDFPAMSAQIVKVQSLASSDSESLNSLTSEILKDVALTNKLLRIVNSAHFSHVGGGHINTVSRAVSLIGFAGIRNVAMSLVLLDHMENKAHATQLKGEFLRALLAGALAADLGPGTREGEEVFIGALLQNLGRMLTEFYLPDEAAQIRQAMAAPVGPRGAAAPTEEQASQSVLGITYEALGQGVGKTWGLPDSMLKLMRKPAGPPPSARPGDTQTRLHWITVAANALADTFLHAPDKDPAAQLRKVATHYAVCLGQSSDSIEKAALSARDKLSETAAAIGLTVPAHSPAAKLLRPSGATPGGLATATDPGGVHELQATTRASDRLAAAGHTPNHPAADDEASRQARADQASAMLATGIQDITNAMVDTFKLNDVLRMILETMYRAMGFRQVLFCLKDGQSGVLLGRFGLGDNASESARHFKVVLNEPNNLLAMVCNKGVDTLIHDASASKVHHNLPPWFHQHIRAQSFMLLPLQLKGTPLGLIYADQATADSIALDDKGLSLLKTLRNQAVMAFRQSMPGR